MNETSRRRGRAPIGSRIRTLRLQRGLTQNELAERAGMHKTELARIEGGVRGADAETTRNLASALGVDLSEILED